MNDGCWHSKTFLSSSFMKERILLRCSGYFELKKMTPNCNALAKSLTFESLTIHLFFLDSVKQCYLQTKKHAVTSSERAHRITWYKQIRRRNRWASKQVSRRYPRLKLPFRGIWVWQCLVCKDVALFWFHNSNGLATCV